MKRKITSICLAAVLAVTAFGASWTIHAEEAVEEAVEEAFEEVWGDETLEGEIPADGGQTAEADASSQAAEQTDSAVTPDELTESLVDPADLVDLDITVWCPEAIRDVITSRIQEFPERYPDYAEYTITVEAVDEEEAAKRMADLPSDGADLFYFTHEQLIPLILAGALSPVGDSSGWVREQNDEGSVYGASYMDTIYAFPVSVDSGYLLYYDTEYIKDVSTLEGILIDCEELKKYFYMDLTSGSGQNMFFFGTGCDINYEQDKDGVFTNANVTCASPEGVKALKAMAGLMDYQAFKNGSDPLDTTDCAAIIAGSEYSTAARRVFGKTCAYAKLPTFYVDDTDYQMSGFSSYHFLGMKPQLDPDKQYALRVLAQDLTDEQVQLACFTSSKWCPSNKYAQYDENVREDPILTALTAQVIYTLPEGPYPDGYNLLAKNLGEDILSGVFDDATEEQLLGTLQTFQDSCLSYAASAREKVKKGGAVNERAGQ